MGSTWTSYKEANQRSVPARGTDTSPTAPRASTSPKTLKPWTKFCGRDPATTRRVFTSLWRSRNRVGFISSAGAGFVKAPRCFQSALHHERCGTCCFITSPSSFLWMLNNIKRTLRIIYSLRLETKLVLPAHAEELKVLYSYIITIIN